MNGKNNAHSRSRWIVPVAIVLLLVAPVAALLHYMTAMPGTSFHGFLKTPTSPERELAARMRKHVAAIASTEHNVEHLSELEQVATYIEETLRGMGYSVKRQNFDSKAGKVRNLEVSIRSKNQMRPDHPVVVLGAHYDSVLGTVGANDNGSGTAAVLELARLLKDLEGLTDSELVLVLYTNEEPPYFKTEQMGSRVHAAEMTARKKNVVGMVSVETIGCYSDASGSQHYPFPFGMLYPDKGNFIAFVGDIGARSFTRRLIAAFRSHTEFPSEGVAAPDFVPGIDWSDHWSYRQEGYPALMITDTAPNRYMHYHTSSDTIDKIDFERMARVVGGIEAMMRDIANDPY